MQATGVAIEHVRLHWRPYGLLASLREGLLSLLYPLASPEAHQGEENKVSMSRGPKQPKSIRNPDSTFWRPSFFSFLGMTRCLGKIVFSAFSMTDSFNTYLRLLEVLYFFHLFGWVRLHESPFGHFLFFFLRFLPDASKKATPPMPMARAHGTTRGKFSNRSILH